MTSSDRLHAGWAAAQRQRAKGQAATSVADRLLAALPRDCKIVTVMVGHPHTLSWLGGVAGHAVLPLGVEQFGQTGTIGDLYRVNGIDAEAIVERAAAFVGGPVAPRSSRRRGFV